MFDEVIDLDERSLAVAESISADLYAQILELTESCKVKPSLFRQIFSNSDYKNENLESLVNRIIDSINSDHGNRDKLSLLHDFILEKYALLKRIDWDIRYNCRLNWWLYLHVPPYPSLNRCSINSRLYNFLLLVVDENGNNSS